MTAKQAVDDTYFLDRHRLLFCLPADAHTQLFCLQPSTAYSGHPPLIYAAISWSDSLAVSFFLEKDELTCAFGKPMQATGRADFLWEENCLELFFGQEGQTAYIEVNAAPDGRYNIYQFSDYRTPNQLPPVATHDYTLTWQTSSGSDAQFYHQGFEITAKHGSLPNKPHLNPTAILYPNQQADQAIFYAAKHTAPADFHDRSVWWVFS